MLLLKFSNFGTYGKIKANKMKEKRGGEKKQKQKYKGVTIFFTLYTIEE